MKNYQNCNITFARLNITNNCNNSCKYCFCDKDISVISNEVIKTSLDFLFKQSLNKQPVCISLFGGEPTLYFNKIKEVIEYGIKLKDLYQIPFYIELFTNGTNLSNELYTFLKYIHQYIDAFMIYLSIDGDRESHNKNRILKNGDGSFDYVFNNINKWKDITKNIAIISCITKNNISNLFNNFIYLTYVLDFKDINFSLIYEEEWDEEDVKIYDIELQKIYNHIFSKYLLSRDTNDLYKCSLLTFEKDLDKICGAGKDMIGISTNGDIYPCPRFEKFDEMRLGNVFSGINEKHRQKFLNYSNITLSKNGLIDPINSLSHCLSVNYEYVMMQKHVYNCVRCYFDMKYLEKKYNKKMLTLMNY